jgi:hypothetical protein
MMPMRMCRKPWHLEKVEIRCRSATAQHIMPAKARESDHACAIPWPPTADRCGSTAVPVRCAAASPRNAALPEISHFAAKFYECCANRT